MPVLDAVKYIKGSIEVSSYRFYKFQMSEMYRYMIAKRVSDFQSHRTGYARDLHKFRF